ncbi:MAG TPA: HisA/HisF-related TIM barrel protein [Acidimicrobiales bacterium]|nr:HisA/HisF-related TIM barrel protein [Acidimicrobiales bacterium]
MQCLPAIDLRGGRCVRLLRGDFAEETVYGDPLEQAAAFVAGGARALHVVDLDAARGASPDNAAVVAGIIAAAGVPVEVGGGVRDEARAEALLGLGAARVVLGTLAAEAPERVRALAAAHPGAIAVGLDHRDGEVALRGWLEGGGVKLAELLAAYEGAPLGAVIVTPIDRDGTLAGPDLEGYATLLEQSALPIVASGGVASLSDLEALRELEVDGRRLAGVVVGKALLSGAMTVAEAVDACGP